MAGCTYTQVLTVSVITEILLVCVGQNTHMQNVAIGKMCDISSKYYGSDTCTAAINGNNKDLYYPENCIHTAESDSSPFWWVDLGKEFIISTITIYGRTNLTERMTQVNIFLDKNIVKRFTSQDTWTNDKHVITVGRVGRIVNITKDSNSGSTMNICEVEVWACDDGWYGDCTQACGHCDGDSVCDKVSGNCTTCQTGFQLPLCTACADGWYGNSCTQTCGRCACGSVCDKVNGNCRSCDPGFQLPRCDVTSDKDKETVSLAGPVAGAAVGCSVAFFIIGVVTGLWLRRFRTPQPLSALCSPENISMSRELGTSISISHPEENPDISSPRNTSDYSNINVYDALKSPDDNNTSTYTSLSLPPTHG